MLICVKQAIEKIIHCITTAVYPGNLVNLDLSESGLKTISDAVSIEIENIRTHLIVSLFNLEKQSEVESLVQNYQSVIIRLLDDLYTYQLDQAGNNNVLALYSAISTSLSDILSFIENYFTKYFNIDQKVPYHYHVIKSENFQSQLSKLRIQFKERAADLKLITIVESCYSLSISDSHKTTITYRQLIYLKELLAELTSISSDTQTADFNTTICNLLVYLNFNHPAFIVYMTDKFSRKIKEQESQQEKVLQLNLQLKQIKQINTTSRGILFKDIMGVKEQLINWIDEEIDYIQKESDVSKQLASDEQKSESELKINTSLSIPQLAFFVRLLVENKTITNINQTQLLKFIALHFTSVKRENISYGHLRSQYYKAELPAIESIKNLLLTLVNLSRKIK